MCVLEEARATLTDEVIELHERMLNSLFSKAKRTQAERLQQTGKLIQSKLRQYIDIGGHCLKLVIPVAIHGSQ